MSLFFAQTVAVEPSVWVMVFQAASAQSLGVLLGVLGAVLGLFWLCKLLGLPEAIKSWRDNQEKQSLAMQGLAETLRGLLAESLEIQRRDLRNHTEVLSKVEVLQTRQFDNHRELMGGLSTVRESFEKYTIKLSRTLRLLNHVVEAQVPIEVEVEE